MPNETAPALDLEQLADSINKRLNDHGQHGIAAEFAAYRAAVEAERARSVVAPQSPAETAQIVQQAAVPTSAPKKAPKAKPAGKKGKSK